MPARAVRTMWVVLTLTRCVKMDEEVGRQARRGLSTARWPPRLHFGAVSSSALVGSSGFAGRGPMRLRHGLAEASTPAYLTV